MSGLTPKQEKFCHAYIETGNASEAYRQAYDCAKMKPETVNRTASDLLNNLKIATRVKLLQADLQLKSDIRKEEILDQLSAIMEAKITDYLEFNGRTIRFKNFKDLTDRQVRAIESIKRGKKGIELKLHGKSWTIERICRMLGYDAPKKQELTGKDGKDLFAQMPDEELEKKLLELSLKLQNSK
jgi:phage terminase small subunit